LVSVPPPDGMVYRPVSLLDDAKTEKTSVPTDDPARTGVAGTTKASTTPTVINPRRIAPHLP